MTKDRLTWVLHGIDLDCLTEWEERFVCDMEPYFERNGDLTERQEEILERIYREKGL
jgi:hypothetical protein